jgi:YfiH family protein
VGCGDGLVTAEPGRGLMGRSADCPIILAVDVSSGAVGMAHASWRGTVGRIASRLVLHMAAAFDANPAATVACICPSAGPCCYEVGGEVLAAATDGIGPHAGEFFEHRGGKLWFDLWSANADELSRAGLRGRNIHVAGICTICRNDLFPSYRVEGIASGRFAAVIAQK